MNYKDSASSIDDSNELSKTHQNPFPICVKLFLKVNQISSTQDKRRKFKLSFDFPGITITNKDNQISSIPDES